MYAQSYIGRPLAPEKNVHGLMHVIYDFSTLEFFCEVIDIGGLVQGRRSSIANALTHWSYDFLALTHRYDLLY